MRGVPVFPALSHRCRAEAIPFAPCRGCAVTTAVCHRSLPACQPLWERVAKRGTEHVTALPPGL